MKTQFLLIMALIALHAPVNAQSDTIAKVESVGSKIIQFCDTHTGKKVGRGECWDLAKYALDYAGAKWSAPFNFGRILSTGEEVMPGDIIQFKNVKIVDGSRVTRMTQHTAIIYAVNGPLKFIVAEQNVDGKRKVFRNEIDLSKMTSGKYTIYRPV